jgi:hypothetical protein
VGFFCPAWLVVERLRSFGWSGLYVRQYLMYCVKKFHLYFVTGPFFDETTWQH